VLQSVQLRATKVDPNSAQITGLLQAWACGDSQALEALTPLVYGELHQIAHRQMRRERSAIPCKLRLS